MLPETDSSELVFRFDRSRYLLIFLPLTGLIVLATAIYGKELLWKLASNYGWWLFVGVMILITIAGPFQHYIKITPTGLTIRTPRRTEFYTWNEMRDIRLSSSTGMDLMSVPIVSAPLVVFNLTEDSPRRNIFRKVARAVLNYDVSFMATYKIAPADLVELLKRRQQQ